MKIKYLGLCFLVIVLMMTMTGCVYFKLNKSPTPVPTVTPTPINADWTPTVTASGVDTNKYPDFIPLIETVRPSVVAIDVTINSFDVLGGSIPQEGAGSGWIIDDSGCGVSPVTSRFSSARFSPSPAQPR